MKWTDFEELEEATGFRVQWDIWDGTELVSDFTPEMDEDPFPMKHKGWTRAQRIMDTIGEAVNIRVVTGETLTPISNKMLRPFAPPEPEPVEE